MEQTRVVIIGASFAGCGVANALLKEPGPIKVILINPSVNFYFPIAAPRILAKPDAFQPEQYIIPLSEGFGKYPAGQFEFIQGYATAMDPDAKTVTIDNGKTTVSFDYLVITSGSTTSSTTMKTGTPMPFKHTGGDDLQSVIEAAQKAISIAESIVIAGGGPIGVELAGELAEAAKSRGDKVEITLVSATDRLLSPLNPSASAAAAAALESMGVHVLPSRRVLDATFSTDWKTWEVSLDSGQKMTVDLYIPTTGVSPNNSFIPKNFLDKDGWLKVNNELRVEGSTDSILPIYAAGDITNNWMRLSYKAVEQAGVVAANIKADILDGSQRSSYDQGTSVNMVVPIGSGGGTGQVFGFTPWSFMVWIMKSRDFFITKARSLIGAA